MLHSDSEEPQSTVALDYKGPAASSSIDLPPSSPRTRAIRIGLSVLLVLLIVAVTYWLTFTPSGIRIRSDKRFVADWVHHHRVIAPAVFFTVYVLLVLAMFPAWWMQLLAGYCFGLTMGVVWSQVAGVVGSLGGVAISRFIAYDWFHRRVESRMQKLKSIDEKLGHNGLLVVMAIRLAHVIPVGVSNYVVGLTKISLKDVAIGSFLGGIPTTLLWAGSGAGYYEDHRLWVALIIVNIILLTPLAIRYWKPQWFQKMGIE